MPGDNFRQLAEKFPDWIINVSNSDRRMNLLLPVGTFGNSDPLQRARGASGCSATAGRRQAAPLADVVRTEL